MVRRFALIFFLSATIEAMASPGNASGVDASFDASLGLRTDNFRWNIAGSPGPGYPDVNVLSELSWRDIKVQEVRLAGDVHRMNAFLFQAYWSGGRIVAGKNQDSDYGGDDRTYEFSRSNNQSDMGDTRDIRIGTGFPTGDPAETMMTPLLGWSYSSERLFMLDGFQTISSYGNKVPLGPFGRLDSHYQHRWTGGWLGLEATMAMAPRLRMGGVFRYYPRLTYLADADWNLRPDFNHPKSFEHTAEGKGWDFGFSLFYALDEDMDVGALVDWRRRWATGGTDTTFAGDGTVSVSPLNEVRWEVFSFGLTARFRLPINDADRRSHLFEETDGPR